MTSPEQLKILHEEIERFCGRGLTSTDILDLLDKGMGVGTWAVKKYEEIKPKLERYKFLIDGLANQ